MASYPLEGLLSMNDYTSRAHGYWAATRTTTRSPAGKNLLRRGAKMEERGRRGGASSTRVRAIPWKIRFTRGQKRHIHQCVWYNTSLLYPTCVVPAV